MMQNEAIRSRPHIPGYGIPEGSEGMVTWEWVMEQVTAQRNYWICTVTPDNRPHATPVWGIWLDADFYHGGAAHTRRARNLATNPHMVMHLESGDTVVIIEGTAEYLTETTVDPQLAARLDAEYVKKYAMPHGLPVWRLRPTKAFAWHDYPTSVTRWVFTTA
ncbi:MAG: pyridoxamine 5'-phosphate oxidase [Chloroflexaceae bacterium]|nr:pyridoxamine 5'-phosphate oxidase [Chloroflexaceae bacterium]NJO05613.1 pyridoxamine 5'-phosphate oxidase [Chloroflexaceae bacterium]